jgi:hypothetical protein
MSKADSHGSERHARCGCRRSDSALLHMLPSALLSAALSSCTTLALAAGFSRLSGGSAAEPVNAVGSQFSGRNGRPPHDFSLTSTLPGVLVNFAGCLFWSNVSTRWAAGAPVRNGTDAARRGAVLAALAYLVDYHVLPRRLRPGYERRLGTPQLLTVYASLAFTLTLPVRMRKTKGMPRTLPPSADSACCSHANRLPLRAALDRRSVRQQLRRGRA